MVASSCTKTGSLSSERCSIWPVARATCSNVIVGFFSPEPRCFRGQKVHADSRTKPMSYQALVGAHLERTEPTFLFGPLEPLFHVPASETDSHHFFDRRVFRSIADEVFDLTRFRISRHNQPILPISRTRPAFGVLGDQVNSGTEVYSSSQVIQAKRTP